MRPLIALLILLIQACSGSDNIPTIPDSPNTVADLYYDNSNADSINKECENNLSLARIKLDALETLPPPYSIDNVLKPLDQLFALIENGTGMMFLLSNVHPDQHLREASDLCVQEFSKLITDIGLSKALYLRVSQVNTQHADAATLRFQNKILSDFKRSGVGESEDTRQQLRILNEEIVKLGQDFSKNIRQDVRFINVSPEQLAGLPDDYIKQHPVDNNGFIKITTDYPDIYPFLRYANDDDQRLAIYREFLNRGYPQNRQVLRELIVKRHQLAQLLGYPDYATYVTEDLMVKTPFVVDDFINRINDLAEERAQSDYAQLLSALQSHSPEATEVGNWQKAYLEEIVRKQKYDLDTKKIREYFQYGNVNQGIFQLIKDLFDVDIKPWNTPVWHPSVKAYEMWDNDRLIGLFYLDMHPRPGKYGHAAQFTIRPGIEGEQLPVAALVCNFPGELDDTELMEHIQVETFLHEFGHLIHSIFGGQQQWAVFSGVTTEGDFVEAPSQMLEEWIWDYDTLKDFARNRQGEVIPRKLVQKMHEARYFAKGTDIQNQMFYAALSLNYYQTPPEQLQLDNILMSTQANYSPFAYIGDTHFYASFGHLDGYSAAYYTYMWSEVIAADILSEFKKKGMRNKELARHYRKTILAAGGSKDASQLVEDFLGRSTSFDAFLQNLNGVQ